MILNFPSKLFFLVIRVPILSAASPQNRGFENPRVLKEEIHVPSLFDSSVVQNMTCYASISILLLNMIFFNCTNNVSRTKNFRNFQFDQYITADHFLICRCCVFLTSWRDTLGSLYYGRNVVAALCCVVFHFTLV